MSDTSSGSPRSSAKSSAKPAAKPSSKKNARSKAPSAPEGVLENLPRTRPQRSSARRDAARKQATTRKRPAKAKTAAKRLQDPAPRQGFETEGDPVSGPVQPPGSVDLLSSAAELAGELAKAGLASGGRLLKDFLTRLPLN
ncbi:MAG TPA: hypothetical protein VIJ66_03065 [Solirubrobacteraceae bacterium]